PKTCQVYHKFFVKDALVTFAFVVTRRDSMKRNKQQAWSRPRAGFLLSGLFLLLALWVLMEPQQAATQGEGGDEHTYLPLLAQPSAATGSCPTTSSQSYSQGAAFQFDLDNPVRPAWNHADKN